MILYHIRRVYDALPHIKMWVRVTQTFREAKSNLITSAPVDNFPTGTTVVATDYGIVSQPSQPSRSSRSPSCPGLAAGIPLGALVRELQIFKIPPCALRGNFAIIPTSHEAGAAGVARCGAGS